MVVRADRPWRRLWALLAALLIVAGVALAAWHAGRHSILAALAGDAADDGNAVARFERIVDEYRALREELAVYRLGGDVARQVEEQVRSDNRQLQDRIAELEEAVGYYRRVVIPDRSGKGLRIERFELVPAGAAQVWSFQLVLVRTGETDAVVEGRLDGVLHATGPSGPVTLPLGELLGAQRQAFRVRYVEDMKVEFRLPDGLRPDRLALAVLLTAPREGRIERVWSSQARTAN